MATQAQTLANKENSRHSTGPRTPEGKAASSQNNKSHGFCSADPVLPHEDREEFNALLEACKSEWAPATTHQEFLVSQLAGARWKLDRVERMEVALLSGLDNSADPIQAFTDNDAGKGFDRLQRYRASLERTYHRCVRELRASQKEQNEANSTQAAEKKFEYMLRRELEAPLPQECLDIMAETRAALRAKWEANRR